MVLRLEESQSGELWVLVSDGVLVLRLDQLVWSQELLPPALLWRLEMALL